MLTMQREVYEYISKQTNDPIVEWKTCRISWKEFAVFQSDIDFYSKISPTINWKKYNLPTPTVCPEERQRRRMSWKNDHMYFKRKCDFSGEPIVSIYHPSIEEPVYKVKHWRSDARDWKNYGIDVNLSESIFDQWKRLHKKVPKIAMVNDNGMWSENCEYCQNMALSKDCYLNTVSWKLRDCYYSSNMGMWELLLDSFFTMWSSICYECIDGYNLYESFFLSNSNDCTKCFFGHELHWCKDCAFCVWLVNKQYYIFNKEYSKEEYEQQIQKIHQEFKNNPISTKEKYQEFLKNFPRKNMNLINTEKSFGNNLVNSEWNIACYNLNNVRSCKYRTFWDTWVEWVDLTVWGELDLCYEWIVPDFSHQAGFTIFCRRCDDIRYSEMCHSCKHCFGCIGLKNQEYCIFNKQYTKEEYEQLVPKIIEKMQIDKERWEFFPTSLSPFAYNHTIAQDYYPLNNQSIEKFEWKWLEEKKEFNIPDNIETINGENLPYDPDLVNDSLLNKSVTCIDSGRQFRIMPKELEFYKKYGIPLPKKHPLQRYRDRIAKMPPKDLFFRTCDNCNKEMMSVYPKDSQYKIYCESCYTKEIYG